MNEMELFEIFIHHGVTPEEIAAMDEAEIEQQIAEMRRDEPDDLPLNDAECAVAIRRYADAANHS